MVRAVLDLLLSQARSPDELEPPQPVRMVAKDAVARVRIRMIIPDFLNKARDKVCAVGGGLSLDRRLAGMWHIATDLSISAG